MCRSTTPCCCPARPPSQADGRQHREPGAGRRPAARRRLEHVVRLVRQHAWRIRGAECRGRRPGSASRSRPRLTRAERLPPGGARPVVRGAAARSVGPAGDRTSGAIADAIRAMAEAGAHEVILVIDPITEGSIRSFAGVLGSFDRSAGDSRPTEARPISRRSPDEQLPDGHEARDHEHRQGGQGHPTVGQTGDQATAGGLGLDGGARGRG